MPASSTKKNSTPDQSKPRFASLLFPVSDHGKRQKAKDISRPFHANAKLLSLLRILSALASSPPSWPEFQLMHEDSAHPSRQRDIGYSQQGY
mmetsp:Transcript_10352/g.29122  ORF Transcript_10352/g.29122 Transcript_10352/m.29122 type:complete len:92 (+) Transcript_10352:1143-1418(+)